MTAKSFREMRKGKGYTQAELASEFGVDVITVSRWERGAVKPIPRLAELALVSLKPKPKGKG
jgi:transcriptional regulator with XRE-family HTH domain